MALKCPAPPHRDIDILRSAVCAALWSHERLFRAKAAVLNLVRGVDPAKEVWLRPVFALRRVIAVESLDGVWTLLQTGILAAYADDGFSFQGCRVLQVSLVVSVR